MALLETARLATLGRWLPPFSQGVPRCLLFLWIPLVMVLGLSMPGNLQAETADSREYQIKAAFLYNFAQFVKWPKASFASADAPFCIGVLGNDPFGGALEETIRGESIDNHPLTVKRSQQMGDLQNCQLIFISRSEGGHIGDILSQINSKSILTVSEIQGFAQDGGVISFFTLNGKVRFEINPQSAQRCGLKISSQLLSLGKIVQ